MDNKKRIRVLLVEDNPGDIRLIHEMLLSTKVTDYEVDKTSYLQEAVSKVKNNFYDIILLDLGLPDSSGINTLKQIQTVSQRSPIIILTVITDEDVGIEAVKLGAQDYLIKGQLSNFALNRAIHYAIERNLSDAMLRENEELFRATFEQAAVGLAHVSLDGRFLKFNDKFLDITGYTPEELSDLKFQDITYPEDLAGDIEQVEKLIIGEIDKYSYEKRYIKKNGDLTWVLITGSLVRDLDGNPKFFIAVVENIDKRKKVEEKLKQAHSELEAKVEDRTRDLSISNKKLQEEIEERRRTELELEKFKDQLRALSSHMESVREEERLHIAREIHDELSQKLSAIKIEVGLIHKNLSKETVQIDFSDLKDEIENIYHIIEEVFYSIRSLLKKIRPELLEELGLYEALKHLIKDFKERSGINCEFIYSLDELPVDIQTGIQIYRIVQESLTNVMRHSGADKVEITLVKTEEKLELKIADNGIGFDTSSDPGGFGILGMKERAVSIGGSLNILTDDNNGTLIEATFPISNKALIND